MEKSEKLPVTFENLPVFWYKGAVSITRTSVPYHFVSHIFSPQLATSDNSRMVKHIIPTPVLRRTKVFGNLEMLALLCACHAEMPKRRATGQRAGYGKRQKRAGYGRGAMVLAPRRAPRRNGSFFARGETKFFDTDVGTVFGTVTAGLESANLNIIVQGNTESNRIGRKVVLTRVDVKGTLTLPSTATAADTSDHVRLLLVCDKQTNGAAFTATDIWETDTIGSFNNLSNSSRFRVLQSKTLVLNCGAGSGRGSTDTLSYGEYVRPFKMGVNLNLPIEFDNSATTGAVTTQRSNSLWLVSQSFAGLTSMQVATSRVRFADG